MRISATIIAVIFGIYSSQAQTFGQGNLSTGLGCVAAGNAGGCTDTYVGDAAGAVTTGGNNTFIGQHAGLVNTTGGDNTCVGALTGRSSITASEQTLIGYKAGNSLTGGNNTCVGAAAGQASTTATSCAFFGFNAGSVNTTGSTNTCLGNSANVGAAGLTNATALGTTASVSASNKVRIGNAAVTVIEGQVAYTFPSDGRFKTNITENEVKGLEFIKLLRPVVYNFDTKKFEEFLTKNMPDDIRKTHFENTDFTASTAIRQSGFVAQEVEQAMKESGYDFNGVHKPVDDNDNYGVAYSLFVVPLVKSVQELSKQNEEKDTKFADLQSKYNDLFEKVKNMESVLNQCCDNSAGRTSNSLNNSGNEAMLEQNSPNPFSENTVVRFYVPSAVKSASLKIFSEDSKELKSYIINERGNSQLEISGKSLSAGNYIYSLFTDGIQSSSKRLTLTK